jgi:formylglycine-generating enzyme required for sulfatase activity
MKTLINLPLHAQRNLLGAVASQAAALCVAALVSHVPGHALAQSAGSASAAPSPANPGGIDWVRIAGGGTNAGSLPPFEIARTETTVGQFRRFVQATGTVTRAERAGGGEVYEAGWTRKPGWVWSAPFGVSGVPAGQRNPTHDDEPAVHITFDEAQAFCRWAGGRLPSDAQWVSAAYTEQRENPPAPLQRGKTYPFPTGDSTAGAQCIGDCGPQAEQRAIRHGAKLLRGFGHARAGTTPAGVNGLHDMGANAWEWVDEPPGARGNEERRTRGGSWWYGAAQMRADHLQGKPPQTAVVYIGFRCVR